MCSDILGHQKGEKETWRGVKNIFKNRKENWNMEIKTNDEKEKELKQIKIRKRGK